MGYIPSMPLTSGSRLGPYEIVAPLGAGGMGEVYRARDERLKRDVAVKVLPASFSSDAERLQLEPNFVLNVTCGEIVVASPSRVRR